MRIISTLVIVILILIAALIVFIYSGVYNVAATQPHSDFTEWILNKAAVQSIKSQSGGIEVPPLENQSMIKEGFVGYDGMCAGCHGAPGVEPSVIAEGLYPEPPDLVEEIEEGEWSESELFWITKHGIKDTGMPAFGPTHSDGELWEIVAFMKQLPEMSPDEYQTMKQTTKGMSDGHDHTHGPGGAEGEHDHGNHNGHDNSEDAESEDEEQSDNQKGKKENEKENGDVHIHKDGSRHEH